MIISVPKIFNFRSHVGIPTIIQTFEMLFKQVFLQLVIIKHTNKHLQKALTYGKFLAWIGLWFFMAMTKFEDQREFWSSKNIDAFDGTPFWMNEYMSCHHYEAILAALQINNETTPSYED